MVFLHSVTRRRSPLKPAILFFLVCTLAGCGVPGPPIPPTAKIPQAPTDLVAQQVGERVVLRWTLPRLHTDGTRLRGLPRIDVYRTFFSNSSGRKDEFAARARVAYVLPAQVVESFLHNEIVVFPDVLGPDLLREEAHSYAVYGLKAVNEKDQDAGFSNLISVRVHPVPVPIARIDPQVQEGALRLRWSAPVRTTSGTPLEAIAGYEVYRSPTGQEGSFALHGTAPTTFYEDTQFEFGQRYFYRVRTLAQFGADTVSSDSSVVKEVLARDLFPPPIPANLIAVASEGRVDLTWDASPAVDLAGYFLYRSLESGSGYQPLNSRPLAGQTFADTAVEPGKRHYYVVSAVDKEGNESKQSAEVAATPLAAE